MMPNLLGEKEAAEPALIERIRLGAHSFADSPEKHDSGLQAPLPATLAWNGRPARLRVRQPAALVSC
jgi:hypothetical protein